MKPNFLPSQVLLKRVSLINTLLGPGWVASAPGGPWTDARSGALDRLRTWREAELNYSRLAAWLIPGLDWLCRVRTEHAEAPSQRADVPGARDSTSVGCAARLIPLLRYGTKVRPAGVETTCAITAYDFLQCFIPALALLYCLYDQLVVSSELKQKPARCLVALAGIPGAGKSVFASILETFSTLLESWPAVQVIGMDGWHLPNKALAGKDLVDESRRKVDLKGRKGCPESFDVQSLARALARLTADPSPFRVPAYDRNRHEPVPDAIEITAPIVLLEGNYVLMRCRGWDEVCSRHHLGIWLDVSCDLAGRRMTRRDVSTGRSIRQARLKWERNDWPNSLAAITGRENADAIVYATKGGRLMLAHRVRESNFLLS